MADRLTAALQTLLNSDSISSSTLVKSQYLSRLPEGLLTRDENPQTHFSVYFAGVDTDANEIFIGHHKKSGLWLFNGGHIDKGEIPEETLYREIGEEWGELKVVGLVKENIGAAELITITEIENDKQTCKRHFDIWHFIRMSKNSFNPDQEKLAKEFHETKWISLERAKELVTDPATLEAVDYLQIV